MYNGVRRSAEQKIDRIVSPLRADADRSSAFIERTASGQLLIGCACCDCACPCSRPSPRQAAGDSTRCPPPDRQKTRKPGVSDGALIGPCAILQTLFGKEFLISAVRFGRGTNVGQDILRAGSVFFGAGTFVVLQHAIGEFDVERRPARTSLVGRRCNLVDHLVLRIIRRYQEVRRARDSKPRLAKYQIRRGREQRAFARVAQIPKSLVHIDEIERNGRCRRRAAGVQGMPDIAMLAEQPEQLPFVLREFAPEQRLPARSGRSPRVLCRAEKSRRRMHW